MKISAMCPFCGAKIPDAEEHEYMIHPSSQGDACTLDGYSFSLRNWARRPVGISSIRVIDPPDQGELAAVKDHLADMRRLVFQVRT